MVIGVILGKAESFSGIFVIISQTIAKLPKIFSVDLADI